MNKLFTIGLSLFFFSLVAQEKEVLVFHKTEGFYHESIPTGIETLKDLGVKNGFAVEETNDSEYFTEEKLREYELIIFLNTSGDVLNETQQSAFKNYIESGGSFFGIHAAADTEFNWKWYGKLVGAYFLDHPEIQKANIIVEAPEHPVVSHLPSVWQRNDEWYNYQEINPEIKVLLRLDEKSYEGGKNGMHHPIAWYQELESGGIAIYTGSGHTKESYAEPAFKEHLLQAICYALNRDNSSMKQ